MKKYFTAMMTAVGLTAILFLGGCVGSRAMEITYSAQSGSQLPGAPIYLNIVDQRAPQELIGPNARANGLFPETGAGYVDLATVLPNGSRITMTNLNVNAVVRQAVSERIKLMGGQLAQSPAPGQLTITIVIDKFVLDVEGDNLVGRATLKCQFNREGQGGGAVYTATAEGSRRKLIGGTGGSAVLGDALSGAVNQIDFSPLNRL